MKGPLTSDWVQAATQKHSAADGESGYGYQWWVYPSFGAYSRKISGFNKPSKANEAAFLAAVEAVAAASSTLLSSLETAAARPRNRGCQSAGAGSKKIFKLMGKQPKKVDLKT
jgi:hypothetical protein